MYAHLERKNLLPDEQRGCRKQARGSKDQLLIDRMVLKNCKKRQVGLAMGWIDYKKAYDMVPHSWIRKCTEMFGVAGNMQRFLSKSMDSWQTDLRSGGVKLGNVKIKRGIFQGDSLSPLLFVLILIPLTMLLRDVKAGYDLGNQQGKINHLLFMDDLKLFGKTEGQLETLIKSVRVFSSDISMEFGIEKCGMLVMKKGKYAKSDGIKLPNEKEIQEIDLEKGYKYLGVLEADVIKDKDMKEKIEKEYVRRVRKILKSKLNGMNSISAINSRADSVVRYGAGIIKWTKEELEKLDRRTRKLLTIHRAFHCRGDVDRLYVKRSKGNRGLISVEDCVNIEVNSLRKHVAESDEYLLVAVKNEKLLGEGKEKATIQLERQERYRNKSLHGRFFKATDEVRDEKTWEWLRKSGIKKETEGLLMAAQEQAIRTKYIRKVIDKEDIDSKCRLCGERDETVAHILAECKMLAQCQYKNWRHDKVAQALH